jgi:two-component system response regulator MprA
VCQAIRAKGIDAPVIFLSARREVHDRLAGFAAGGDDYLVKPFAFPELVARLRALVRRHTAHTAESDSQSLRVDPGTHAVHWRSTQVELSPIEYRLLALLLSEPSTLVRRVDLRAAGWPAGAIVSDNTLDQYVTKLRRKLTELGAPFRIRSVRGVGYQLRPTD